MWESPHLNHYIPDHPQCYHSGQHVVVDVRISPTLDSTKQQRNQTVSYPRRRVSPCPVGSGDRVCWRNWCRLKQKTSFKKLDRRTRLCQLSHLAVSILTPLASIVRVSFREHTLRAVGQTPSPTVNGRPPLRLVSLYAYTHEYIDVIEEETSGGSLASGELIHASLSRPLAFFLCCLLNCGRAYPPSANQRPAWGIRPRRQASLHVVTHKPLVISLCRPTIDQNNVNPVWSGTCERVVYINYCKDGALDLISHGSSL